MCWREQGEPQLNKIERGRYVSGRLLPTRVGSQAGSNPAGPNPFTPRECSIQRPVLAPEHDGLASKEIHAPQAVSRVADER
jgi:hypothetical protein